MPTTQIENNASLNHYPNFSLYKRKGSGRQENKPYDTMLATLCYDLCIYLLLIKIFKTALGKVCDS